MSYWKMTVHFPQWEKGKKKKTTDVFKMLFEVDNPESIDIQSNSFKIKGHWECCGMVWQNGEQDKSCYRKGLKNLLVHIDQTRRSSGRGEGSASIIQFGLQDISSLDTIDLSFHCIPSYSFYTEVNPLGNLGLHRSCSFKILHSICCLQIFQ